jgi:hypothetical protein
MSDGDLPDKRAVIKLPIRLHIGQKEVNNNPARFKVIETGCRWGKTEYGIYYLLTHAQKMPGYKHWIVFPFAKQGRSILWNRLLSFIPAEIIQGKPNKTLMDIRLCNESEIGIRGSDNESSLRGEKLGSVIQDEAAFQKSHVWEEILRPRLIDSRGDAMFISSPMGMGWHHKLWEYAKSGVDTEWAAWHFTTYDNPYISREELDKLKITTPPRVWNREYLGIAASDEGVVYGEYGIKNNFDHNKEFLHHEENTPCGRGMDWAAGESGDDAACIWVHQDKNDILVSAEHIHGNWSVPKHATRIKEMSTGRRLVDGLTVLDQSAFRTEGTSQTSIGKLFADCGIQCARGEKYGKDSGIAIIKDLLEGKPGQPRLLISNRCPQTQAALRLWEYGQHEPDPLAALRYVIIQMHKRGLFKLNGVYLNNAEPEAAGFNPMSIFDQRALKNRMAEENQELQWSMYDE